MIAVIPATEIHDGDTIRTPNWPEHVWHTDPGMNHGQPCVDVWTVEFPDFPLRYPAGQIVQVDRS